MKYLPPNSESLKHASLQGALVNVNLAEGFSDRPERRILVYSALQILLLQTFSNSSESSSLLIMVDKFYCHIILLIK